MKTFRSETHQDRESLLAAINLFLEGGEGNQQQATGIIADLSQKYKDAPYTIARVIWGGRVKELSTSYAQKDVEYLFAVKSEIEGNLSHWRTYIIRHNFRDYLDQKNFEIYEALVKYLHEYKEYLETGKNYNFFDVNSSLHASIYEIYSENTPINIADLILVYACHQIMLLPTAYPKKNIDLNESNADWGHIGRISGYLNTHSLLSEIEGFVAVLKGKQSIFVDVFINDGNPSINVRLAKEASPT